jgi:hypothetical protein
MPLRGTSLNGVRTLLRRFLQQGLISRYSIRLTPATIFVNHFRLIEGRSRSTTPPLQYVPNWVALIEAPEAAAKPAN